MVKIYNLFVLAVVFSTMTSAQNSFQESFLSNPRPSKENIQIPVKDNIGNEGYLPVSVYKGGKEGPIFTIIAGVHGFEYPPIIATQELMQEIDPNKLSGTIIFIPIASRGSFYGREPFKNPKDQVNLNNAFPGSPTGTITEQVARIITDSIIPVTDVFLDIHGGDAPEDLLSFICYYDNADKPRQTKQAEELSLASGFQYVVSYPYTISDDEPAKYAFKQAVQDGKTGLSIESGKLGTVHEECVSEIKKGVHNMLKKMEMYGNPAEVESHPNVIRRNHQVYVRSNSRGIFYSSHKAGDAVNANEIVGYTTDEFGNVLEEYTAPISGIILYKLSTPPINKGDTVMCISTKL